MNLWVIILVGGVITLAIRASFIFLHDRIRMPDWFNRGLRFVPLAVLSAIILPALTLPEGSLVIPWRNPQLLAGALAILVAWKTKNVVITIAAGMAALLIIQYVFGIG